MPKKSSSSNRAKKSGHVSRSRDLTVKVKSAKGRKLSSTRWLERQLNDPYVNEAKRLGYRSRAAFKLRDLNTMLPFLKPGMRVVDLGAAPGGWCQVAAQAVDAIDPPTDGDPLSKGKGRVVGVDLTPMEPIPNVSLLQGDITDPQTITKLLQALDGPADAVISDMAASSTGHRQTDHLRVMALVETGLDFAEEVLSPGGVFVAKVLRGGADTDLLTRLKQGFETVKHLKPESSRSDSREMYVIALGFRGREA